ncbi:hypothetical protein [Burkholderia gladioli]|uniref:hypothetical protein n=1 Tax=Burkholderia gladioli TaxID=28095 RepID=UPI0016407677|nr:hypothetical protein [Burkholderia gladioli]
MKVDESLCITALAGMKPCSVKLLNIVSTPIPTPVLHEFHDIHKRFIFALPRTGTD